MRREIRGLILGVAAIAILGSAMLQGIVNVPHLHDDLSEIGVRPRLLRAVLLVLYFSVAAMFAFGLLVLINAVGSLRNRPPQQAVLWLVAAIYSLFGLGAFVTVSRSPHILGYAFMGLLVAIGAAMGARPDRRRA